MRDVAGERPAVEFTPTFLGCPALEVMRDQMARARELGGEPEVAVISDDSLWSTDRITPEGREKLRAAGFCAAGAARTGRAAARPAPVRRVPPLLRLDGHEAREPFGPTPCRSLRYCRSCRQLFEQFKTI